MNNTFDFGRFSLLVRRQWINFGKVYLMSLGIVVGVFMSFYGYYLYRAINNPDEYTILGTFQFRPYMFIILGLSFISIVASTYFSNLGDKTKAIFELLIPATHLEKFLSAILYSFLVPTVSFLLLFFCIDFAFVSYVREYFADFISAQVNGSLGKNHFEYFYAIKIPSDGIYTLFIPVLVSAIFLLGSIYFHKFQYIKTAIALVIYWFVYIIAMIKVKDIVSTGEVLMVSGVQEQQDNMLAKGICIIGLILTLVFWIIGYYRLKEKEV